MAWYAALAAAGASLGGSIINYYQNEKWQNRSWSSYNDSLRNSIAYRVADAQRSGIHPLYALGANVQSAQFQAMPSDSLGNGISNAGQILANYALEKKDREQQRDLISAQIESLRLQNEQRAIEIEAYQDSKVSVKSSSPFSVAETATMPKTEYSGFQGVSSKYQDTLTRYATDSSSGDWHPSQDLVDLISEDFFSALPYHQRKVNKLHEGNFRFWHEKAEQETTRLHREKLLPEDYVVVADYDLAAHGGFYPRIMKINHPNDYRNIPYMKYLRSGSYRFFNDLGNAITKPFRD